MKKILLSLALFLAIGMTSFATTYTVSNDPLGGSQYTTLAAAMTAASSGDTLIVEGSDINYTAGTWNKKLVIIGAGFNAQTHNFKPTKIVNNVTLTSSANGSRIYGIQWFGVLTMNGCNDIIAEDCHFPGNSQIIRIGTSTACTNITIRNCIFTQNSVNAGTISIGNGTVGSTNILISNCSFDGWIFGSNTAANRAVIDHCQFLGTNASSYPIRYLHNSTISNCIFAYRALPYFNTSSTYLNNICKYSGTDLPTTGGNTGNLNNTDPQFETYTYNALYSNAHNYKLKSTSPGKSAANDGTDIGIFGGSSNFSQSGEVLIAPVMRLMNVNNFNVQPGDSLFFDINATKPLED